MISIRTWLTHWWGRLSIARWWYGDPNAPPFPPDIMAKINATVEKLEVTFTERTVAQIQAELRARAIVVSALSTIHHALRRIGFTRKKRRYEPPSKTGPMSLGSDGAGGSGSATWTRAASCSSTRPERPPT